MKQNFDAKILFVILYRVTLCNLGFLAFYLTKRKNNAFSSIINYIELGLEMSVSCFCYSSVVRL